VLRRGAFRLVASILCSAEKDRPAVDISNYGLNRISRRSSAVYDDGTLPIR